MKKALILGATLATVTASPAFAHLDPVAHGSWAAGFSHPFTGLDHILAMLAVGLWAAMLGGRAVWLVPSAFVVTMLVGFAAALSGASLPFVEPVVSASVLVLGLVAALALRLPVAAGMALVAVFAFFHGFAHGGELGGAGAGTFAAGFALATAILHLLGLGLGLGLARFAGSAQGRLLSRTAGGLTALAGLWLTVGAFS